MEKPSYSTSKRHLWISSGMAWTVILLLTIGAIMGRSEAVAFGTIAVPSMVTLIAALLGIHRISGSMDFRVSNQPREPPEGNR